jgi:hypothetical protein
VLLEPKNVQRKKKQADVTEDGGKAGERLE